MASDLAGQLQSGNACCKMWKEKYASLEYKRNALRQAVNILQPQIDRFQAENANLRKAYEEEQARADNEKEGRLKESMARVSLENEIFTLKSEISSLQQKTSTNALDRNEEVKILQVRVSEGEKEINRLKELLGKEKRRADAERKNAEGEKKKAAEELKSIKAEKSKADEQRSFAKIEGAKAEQYRLQLEMLKKEADEAKSKLASETLKFEQANKKLEAEKQKAIKERKRVESEMAKVEEQRKLAEANGKKALQEKCRAENLSRQLEENRQSVEELQKEILEFVSSGNLAPSGGQVDNKSNPEYEKMKDRLQSKISNVKVEEPKLVLELFKESKKRFEIEKQKAIDEKKCADLDIAKVEEQAKLVEVNWKKAMEEKCRADQLTQQLQEDKRTIEELQKKIHELLSSRKLVEGSVVPPHRVINSEYSNVKHLKKQLRFEKVQAKHAKQVAKFEKSRNHIMQQEFGRLKMEFDKFANHLYISNNSFSPSTEGTDDLEKAWHIACMQRLNMKKQLCCLAQSQAHFQSENELLKPSCIDMDSSDPVRKTIQCSAPLLPLSGGNFAESISGINSKLESLLGCSNRKLLQTSAINSSTASFSDGQLMGSQGRGAFSVTTSAKLVEENLNAQPTISNLSGEVTKIRCNEKSAEVAENNVIIPDRDDVGRVCEHIRKRKRVPDSVESIEYLYSKGKKLHMQIEEKLSVLHGMLGRQVGNPLGEDRCSTPNLQCIPYTMLDGFHKGRKSHDEVLEKQFCESDERKKTEKVVTEVLEDAIDLETTVNFEDVADGDYMKLLVLDNAADEECYKMAMEVPLSPTLPNIDFHGAENFDVDNSEALVVEWAYEGLSTDKENLLPAHSFDVIDVEINSNKLKHNVLENSRTLLLHKSVGPLDYSCENGSRSVIQAGKVGLDQTQDSGEVLAMSNLTISRDEELKFPVASELGPSHANIPKYCVLFPNMRDCNTVSRIFSAAKNCVARCCLLSQTEWMVPKILLAIKMEENLLLAEKVCVFFTLLLLNLSTAAPRKFGSFLNRDSILCMDSFAGHILKVMSDVETRSIFADFGFVDELLSLIEDFLIYGRVIVYDNVSSETSVECDSRIDILLDGVNIILLDVVASADLLVAGSIILASICASIDHIAFICETSYNIFRRCACDSSLVLTILHVFAYLGGQKFFSLGDYKLMMMVLKSIVMLLEGVHLSVDAAACPLSVSKVQLQFHPCVKCPFLEGAISIDTSALLLLELLQNIAVLGTTNHDVIKSFNALNSRVLCDNFNSEQYPSHEEVHCVADLNCDASCSLKKCEMPASQSDSVDNMTLCHLSDVLSLVELVACNMSWDWTSIKVVPQLLKILESCVLENFAAAVVVLLGQLGRLGVDAGGYEDKGVENLRCNLSAFLSRDATMKAGLPVQIATVTALLGLLPLDFETLVQRNVKLQETATQSVLVDYIWNWFSLLSKEQQELSVSLLQTAGAKKK
ncbi:uncharacterized protein LOC126726747 [Quercus robur]|uniref:uncharacterized protein LOC126726747 n=1 Tax=Quercus robur TaxID=38942 RepID=UPI0021623CF5|nr:uncharacterized protein LOC126726747 [Quercus robur]